VFAVDDRDEALEADLARAGGHAARLHRDAVAERVIALDPRAAVRVACGNDSREVIMRRVLAIGLIVLLALAGFYVAWPAWTAFQIRQAIEANDPSALERKIDFVSVRARAKPFAAAQMQRSFDELPRKGGSCGAALAGQLR
jgi:hypothetical protein